MVGTAFSTLNVLVANRPHEGGRNYAFMDGHVEWRLWKDVKSKNFGLLIAGANTYEPEGVSGNAVTRAGQLYAE